MISVQKSHMKYIWQRYLQPTIIDGWRPAPVETVNRTMSAPVPAERHQSRWHFRDRDSASDNIRGITVAIPTNISGEATRFPAGPVIVPYEMIRGKSHGARVIILTESSWRNTRRWHFRSLGYELQPPMHTHIIACLTQAYPSSLTLCTEGVCQCQIHECLTNIKDIKKLNKLTSLNCQLRGWMLNNLWF